MINKRKQCDNKNINNKSTSKTKKREKLNKRTIFTITAMINITWYAIAVLIANFLDHSIQAELTVAWFSAWTVELALLYGIQIKQNDNSSESECDATATNDNVQEDDCKEENITDNENCDNSDGGVG